MELARKVGASVINALSYLGALAVLAGRAAYSAFIGPFLGKPVRFQSAVAQAMQAGVRALPILSLITFFIGLILALERSFRILEVRWPRWVEALPGYTVGSLGAFWTVQRLAIFFGGS